jgi:DNA invertase Pin-like site-specific DNA recombinase
MAKKDRIRVVAYARVSTMAQVNDGNSLTNQQSYFKRVLDKDNRYSLVTLPSNHDGIYADKGISGTKLRRPAFEEMLKDAGLKPIISARTDKETDNYEIVSKPKFDMIFVKDTTRFARNVSVDTLLKTLQGNNVAVYFLDIDKRTDSNADMTYIQLFLSIGERESRDRSTKTKFGHTEAHRRGDIAMGGKMYGYTYIHKSKQDLYNTGILQIDDKEAKLVRLVFDMYTEKGFGDFRICQELFNLGYLNRQGKKFTTNSIARMLKNEKYIGVNDAGKYDYGPDIFHKKITDVDYNDKDRKMARDATEKLKEKGVIRIPAIISVEQFQKAQEIRQAHCDRNKVKRCVYNGITPYARKIKCAKCGEFYIANSRKKAPDGTPIRRYACKHHTHYNNVDIKQCNNPTVKESELDALLNSPYYYEKKLSGYEEVLGAGEGCIAILQEAMKTPDKSSLKLVTDRLAELQQRRERLLDLYENSVFDKEELDNRTKELESEIRILEKKKDILEKPANEIKDLIATIKQLMDDAEAEESKLKATIKTGKLSYMDIRKNLRDVNYITVGEHGELSIVFNSVTELNKVADYIDRLSEPFIKVDKKKVSKKQFKERLYRIIDKANR